MRARFQPDDEPQTWARAVHRTKRLWFLAIFGNALLFGLMLGVPYARGLLRAQAMRSGYAQSVACLLGGKATQAPGLGPLDDVAGRFATRVLTHDPTWLGRCDRALSKLAPAAAVFVWPPAKEGEARVREAVAILRRELAVLKRFHVGQRLPVRPVRALEQLVSVMHQHATLTGALNLPPQASVTFSAPATRPTPARLPLYAGADAVLTLWGNDSELFAVGVDRTGVSYLHADKARLERARHVRPKLLQSFLRVGEVSYLAYAVATSKCRERVGGCARKSMGLATATLPLTRLPAARWLASHPVGRLDQSLHHVGAGWIMAAESEGGETQLRQINLPDQLGGDGDTILPPAPLTSLSLPSIDQVLLVGDPLAPVMLGAALRAGESLLLRLTVGALAGTGPVTEQPVLARLAPAEAAWAATCFRDQVNGFALGSGRALVLGHLHGASSRVWAPVAITVTSPFHQRDPAKDAVVRLCVREGALAFVRDAQDRLWLVRCAANSATCSLELASEAVSGFAVLQADQSILLAYAGAGEHAQIRVQRYDMQGNRSGSMQVPSACWAPSGGMCGQPYLTRIGTRLVLSAREGTDLVMLESPDEGQHWEPLAHDGQVHL